MKNPINWFEIYVSDMQRARIFYNTVFQCELKDVPMNNERHPEMQYAFFTGDPETNGATGALVKMDAAQPGAGGTLVYFATDEINAELSRVDAAGGKVLRAKLPVPDGGFIALIQDTEENMIGLSSKK
ncbi:VOC family protein [Mucilaginibacter sp. R-33]|uniref:VOC family protein n=1 Tax=Mucilaginibacter sp. R-33 TaxID=3416711 RepID=UPI003CFACA68